jgi:hypothetical protein
MDNGKPCDHAAEAAVTIEGPVYGTGRCKACHCRGYRPNYPKNDYCKDCGHSWYMHENA